MKKFIIATTALTLTYGVAQAQNGTGPAAQTDNMNKPAMTTGKMEKGDAHKSTTGSAMKPDASQQGAGTAASVNAKGTSTEPGKVQEGKTR
jgi:hypothetical protein